MFECYIIHNVNLTSLLTGVEISHRCLSVKLYTHNVKLTSLLNGVEISHRCLSVKLYIHNVKLTSLLTGVEISYRWLASSFTSPLSCSKYMKSCQNVREVNVFVQ